MEAENYQGWYIIEIGDVMTKINDRSEEVPKELHEYKEEHLEEENVYLCLMATMDENESSNANSKVTYSSSASWYNNLNNLNKE